MKMLPVQLSLNPPLGLWSDVLWRCPPAPPSQLAELKTQLPASLPSDPRLWCREDVTVFLRFCEREFDLPKVDHDLFQMNGKALCLLTRADFGHRCPGAGDVLHNVLQMLVIESHMMQWHLPNSPVTPTSRYPLSPHSHPPTPTWPPIAPPESPFHNAHMHHFMAPNSVTLSPPPSVDSQASSPPQGQDQNGAGGGSGSGSGGSSNSSGSSSSTVSISMGNVNAFGQTQNTASTSSNHSDSDEESSYSEAANNLVAAAKNNAAAAAAAAAAAVAQYNSSPPTTPILKDMPQSLTQQITNSFVNSWSQSQSQQHGGQNLQQSNGGGGSVSAPTTPSYMQPVKREFFPENSEPNTNGRLLWDFLQQLLNDRNQKYSDLIAWKCRDTGVFKIVDPAGLAKLWGIQKNHLSMNYDKMSRALRYYYRVNILRKVQGERHCYQFLRNPTELKNIKNISLLRQTVQNNGGGTSAVANGSGSNAGSSSANNQSPSGANVNSTNWPLPHQNMSVSLQQAAAAAQQQTQSQRPSSRSNNHNNNHMSLPTAAAVAAAAAAAYGPPPSSPLFMHAINGAFHYLQSNTGPPPNSPAATLPSTPNDKFQFNTVKQESSEEMKPTDLSVTGPGSSNEKRPYSSPSANEDGYPLIRNADGLTTIKLIRYNESDATSEHLAPGSPRHVVARQDASLEDQQQQQQHQPTPMPMDSADGNSSEASDGNQFSMMPTDLRK